MKICILTMGTRGDVQPFLALGQRLGDAGNRIVVSASENLRPLVEECGLEYAFLNQDLIRLMDRGETKQVLAGGGLATYLRKAPAMMKLVKPLMRKSLEEQWLAAKDADAIIFHPKAVAGRHIAEKLSIPCFKATPIPMLAPTGDFPHPLFPAWSPGRFYNRLTYRFMPLMGLSLAGVINQWRENILGLGPAPAWSDPLRDHRGKSIPLLHCFSEHICPRPQDWPPLAVVTGYWFLPAPKSWRPDPALSGFLDKGPPPVYVGFGSMPGLNPKALAQSIFKALRLTGLRGILARGWGGLEADELPPEVFMLDSAPHDWLFPKTAAVVHHGGAGTTAAGLLAGKPSLVCPFFGDQPFWARRVHGLGLGPRPIPGAKITAENMARALVRMVSDKAMAERARAMGRALQAEDGAGRATEFILQRLNP